MSLVPIPIGGSVPNLFHFRDSFAFTDFALVFFLSLSSAKKRTEIERKK